jgi:hypothetical protein
MLSDPNPVLYRKVRRRPGWDEHALYDAVSVCALFNFMNRLVEGLGIRADPGYFNLAAERLAIQGYATLLAPPTPRAAERGRAAGGDATGTRDT